MDTNQNIEFMTHANYFDYPFQVDDEKLPMNFCQVFTIFRDELSFFVSNDIFRLVYG